MTFMALADTEKHDLRVIVEGFWGKHETASWEMNEELVAVLPKMISEVKSCSQAMDFVPRPGVYLNPKDVQRELRKMARRVKEKGTSYWVCMLMGATNWKTEAARVAQGL
ncbi:hypothetical protein Gmet_0277 [Geobacter metallireducens GS-15]|uniref:Uncharacterized protein n=2 Tax=Geobacteraceae TaxID=213422 RepID=Q39Z02_GEOMG|nr:hypothetical protein Gmet_0277 [Geobacter metallireducens GS-15]